MAFDLSELPTRDGMFLRDAIGGEIRDTDEAKGQVLVTFPHDTVDTFKTTFDKDAFRASFQKRMPLMCWQHDLRDPIGHAIDAQVNSKSNDLVGQLDDFDAVPNAKRAFSQIHSKTITDFSFGFREPVYEQHKRIRGVRNIRSATMMEFSPVSVGSIPGAVATGLREEEAIMSERSAAEIATLVESKVISPEEGRRMLAELDGYRDHIHVLSPTEEMFARLEKALSGGTLTVPTEPLSPEQKRIDDLESQVRELKGETLTPEQEVVDLRSKVEELQTELATRSYEPPPVPAVINVQNLVEALPEPWQRALDGAAIAIGPAGTEFYRDDETDTGLDENVKTIVEAIDEAHRSAAEWLKDTDTRALPEEVQQSLLLFGAAGESTSALMDVVNIEGRAKALSPSHEPGDAIGSENMDPTEVKCMECNGKGETEDGKTCPKCGGSGIEAVTRADPSEMTNDVDEIPATAVKCTMCKGTGSLANGTKCRVCKGKGWMPSAKAMAHRADSSSWSDKPWSDFTQADYSPEQWRDACLIVEGDGSTKAQCKLPVKEPDGTYNVNGIAAAAARINQVEGGDQRDAAEHLSSLYRQMDKEVPPEVAKLLNRSDDEEANVVRGDSTDGITPEDEREAALARLNKVTARGKKPAKAGTHAGDVAKEDLTV